MDLRDLRDKNDFKLVLDSEKVIEVTQVGYEEDLDLEYNKPSVEVTLEVHSLEKLENIDSVVLSAHQEFEKETKSPISNSSISLLPKGVKR